MWLQLEVLLLEGEEGLWVLWLFSLLLGMRGDPREAGLRGEPRGLYAEVLASPLP